MTTRAKFYVYSKTLFSGGGSQVTLQPVSSGSEENKSFWKYTPSGKIELTLSPEATNVFEVGKEYYIDFTPVEA